MYFYKSAKWLSGIEVTRDVHRGYWEEYGYSVDAWIGSADGPGDVPTG
jgi:DMSO/TMAO reductase YedYZ molybdopterin-dependent catalytic subunit